MQEIFEGTRIIEHEDGSTTTINYSHEPYVEPLSTKGKLLAVALLTVGSAFTLGLPWFMERSMERADERRVMRMRQKKNREIFDNIPT